MKLKKIMRYDSDQKRLRLFALIWGDANPLSFKTTFALVPKLFGFRREYGQVRTALLGLSVNHHWSAGGRFC